MFDIENEFMYYVQINISYQIIEAQMTRWIIEWSKAFVAEEY